MKISAIQLYSPYKRNYQNFGQNYDTPERISNYNCLANVSQIQGEQPRGIITLNNSKIYNRGTTYFFRNDIDWLKFGKYLKERFKDVPKINTYNYGCSTGLETYSLSILLQYSQNQPERFFPIKARDINKRTIALNKADQAYNYIEEDGGYDEYYNIKSALHISDKNLDKFATVEGGMSKKMTEFTDATTSPVDFEYGNILDDVDKIDDKYPSIIFARNMWPYIDSSEYDNFTKKLYEKLAPGSIFVIGNFDNKDKAYISQNSRIADSLLKAGFIPHSEGIEKGKGQYIVFEKNGPKTKDCIKGQIIKNGEAYNKHKTAFLREDLKWDNLMNYINKKYQYYDKVNVYDYACSSAEEAYTISMGLQESQINPEKFFPIEARDISESLIEEK